MDDEATKTPVPADPINPPHYRGDRVMRIIEQYGLGFCLGNFVKYVLRHEAKAGIEDLRKARWYLDRSIRFGDQLGHPPDRDPPTAHPSPEDDISSIVEEFGLGFCLGSAVDCVLRRPREGQNLRAALRFLDRKILVLSEGVLPPPGPVLGLEIASSGAGGSPAESLRAVTLKVTSSGAGRYPAESSVSMTLMAVTLEDIHREIEAMLASYPGVSGTMTLVNSSSGSTVLTVIMEDADRYRSQDGTSYVAAEAADVIYHALRSGGSMYELMLQSTSIDGDARVTRYQFKLKLPAQVAP